MKIGIAELTAVSPEEKMWLDSIDHPFSTHQVSDSERYDVLMSVHTHEHFNPSGHAKFYIQRRNAEDEPNKIAYDINSPLYVPTGTFSVNHNTNILCCLGGFLHDASGYPAFTSDLFGDEYYLHGKNFQPIDYFRYLEKEKGRYPEYQPQKYVEFMASVLGKRN